MYSHHIQQDNSKDQPDKLAYSARGQLNRENDFFPVPVRAWGCVVSRDGFSSPVPRQLTHLYSGWIWCLLTGFLPSSKSDCFFMHYLCITDTRTKSSEKLRPPSLILVYECQWPPLFALALYAIVGMQRQGPGQIDLIVPPVTLHLSKKVFFFLRPHPYPHTSRTELF